MVARLHLAQSDLIQGIRYFLQQAIDRPFISAIELLLIGSVVYTVLRALEGTRGARLVRAVLLILGVSFAVVWLITERFGFERINALYPYFILAVFLVSLVAFQSELRRLLMRVGEGAWLGRWLGISGSEDTIDAIVAAVERLSRKKIGALMAIERGSDTTAVAESGVSLDAMVTAELLETIFWPGSALHDLGVLIHQDRIRAAGCQFPLAESDEVDRSLGSRHRAAVGMSHETDTIVVVVSEETGTISAALQGKLHRPLTADGLREYILVYLAGGEVGEMMKTVQTSIPSKLSDDRPRVTDGKTDGISPAANAEKAKDGAGQAA